MNRVSTLLACSFFLCFTGTVLGQILVDDFSEVTSSSLYPFSVTWPDDGGVEEFPLSTTIGTMRSVFPRPIPFNTATTDATATVNIDTTVGKLDWSTTPTAQGSVALGWSSADVNAPMNIDVSGQSEVVVAYENLTAEFRVILFMGNNEPGSVFSSALSQFQVDIPTTLGLGELRIPLDELSATPGFSEMDPASIDVVSLDLSTQSFGASFSLHSVTIVPEPAFGPVALLFLVTLFQRTVCKKLQR